MAEKTINARIQCKIDTAENWKTNNPVLLVGELGVESDTKLIKVGDGTTSWTSLPYLQYLPLSGGQLTGALKIAKGTGNGIQNYDGTPLLYIDNYDDLYIRNDSGAEIHLGTASGEHIQIGGNKVLSDTNVVGHSFTFNDKSVAVTSDIPKTLNNKTLVANGDTTIYGTDITLASDNTGNLTDAINGKADTSAIPTALFQLSEDITHRVVTDTEKATWNAKSNFDGDYNSLTNKPTIPTNADFTLAGLKEKSYNSLTDKPTIPTKTSQLTNDSNFATTSQIPTKTSQLTNDSGFATTSQIPDISGKANLSGGNTFSGTQTFNNGVTLANDTAITNASGNNVVTTQTGGHTILGDPNGVTNIQGSTTRPLYTKKDSASEQLALYTDTKDKLPLTGGNLTGYVTTTKSFTILNSSGSTNLGSIGAFDNNYVGIDATNSIVLGKNGYTKIWFITIDDDGNLIFEY